MARNDKKPKNRTGGGYICQGADYKSFGIGTWQIVVVIILGSFRNVHQLKTELSSDFSDLESSVGCMIEHG